MQSQLRSTLLRNARALELRPSVGRGTAVTRVRLLDGVACEIEDGRWKLNVDMSKRSGGGGEAPDPGVYGRGALGSCLAVSIAQQAALRCVAIDDLSVEVHAGYDARGTYGLGDADADYTSLRYVVNIASPASDEELDSLLREAERQCTYLHVFARPHRLEREIRIER